MNPYFIVPIQTASWKYVLIYDESDDVFYTTVRKLEQDADKKMVKVLIALFAVCGACHYLCDSFISTYLWSVPVYLGLITFTIAFSCISAKRYFAKIENSMNVSLYDSKNFTLVMGLDTPQERKAFFLKWHPQKRALTMDMVAITAFFAALYLSVLLRANYSTITLFMALGSIYMAVFFLFYARYFLKNKAMNYLLQKFALI